MEMKSTVIGRLEIHHNLLQLRLRHNLTNPRVRFCKPNPSPIIVCGLRKGLRKPLWRSRVLSTEAIQAVQTLKLAKSPHQLEKVINERLCRLLKSDLLDTLTELQRQNQVALSLKVFKYIRFEACIKLDLSLYHGMIMFVGKIKAFKIAEELFDEMKNNGIEPDTRAFNEMIGAYLQVGMIERAIETYGSMKESGCSPDRLTFTILIKNLDKFGEEFVAVVKKECDVYLDSPEKFLEEIEQKQVKN